MRLWQRSQPLCGLLCRQVSLGFGQHLVADHKLSHCGRAQERRVKVRVELPVRKLATAKGCPVPTHRVGERCLKEIVVFRQHPLEDVCQRTPLAVDQVRQALAAI